jgi:hypothetical protein
MAAIAATRTSDVLLNLVVRGRSTHIGTYYWDGIPECIQNSPVLDDYLKLSIYHPFHHEKKLMWPLVG